MFLKFLKLVLLILLSYQTPLYSKSATFNDFNSRDLSNYFSGIVAFENRDNSEALKFFNLSKVLINRHDGYLKRYVNSLVLDNKVAQAINVLNNNVNKSNSDFYDAYIILIIDSLKKNNFKKADKYLTQSLKFQDEDRINLVIFESLKQYIYTFKHKKILDNKKNFGNLSLIAETFQRCYIKDKRTSSYFLNLINNQQGDYSRYIFFYLNYLIDDKKLNEARLVVEQIDYINSTLLLSQSKSWVEKEKFDNFGKIFSCKDHNDLVSEFLFLISNLYSSQDNFEKSNFYLNLSNYLNPKFEFNLSLVAENFYLNDEFDKVKRILKNFKKDDEFYYWFRLKKEAQIIIQERDYGNGIKYIDSKFNKIKKLIPQEAGLGGGSMNAASVFNYLVKKKIINPNYKKTRSICDLVGSDVILGTISSSCVLSSSGRIKKIYNTPKYYSILVKPDFGCSTKKIYSAVRKYTKSKYNKPKKNMFGVKYLIDQQNSLETIVLKKYPKIKKIKLFLESINNPLFVRMTGSGSTIVAYYNSLKSCKLAKAKFKRKYKNYWCVTAKTI